MPTLSALVVPLSLLLAAAPNPGSIDKGECAEATFSGAATYDPATDAFVGGGTMNIKGGSIPIAWSSILLGQRAGEYTSSHLITSSAQGWGNERISTFDQISLTPTASPAAFDFVSHMKVATGTGKIDSGELLIVGLVDFAAGTVTVHSARGKLCNRR